MGVDRSATQQLLQWKALGKAASVQDLDDEKARFNLDGPFYCLQAGSSEVKTRYACLRDDLLLMGPKRYVVDEFVALSGKRCLRSGQMIGFCSGRTLLLQLVVGSVAEAEQWETSATAAAAGPRANEQFLDKLQAAMKKQKKAEAWRRRAAKIGSAVEWLCGGRPMERHRASEMPPVSSELPSDAGPGSFFQAEGMAEEVRKAAEEVPSGRPSTTRRQLGSAACCVCSAAMQVPRSLCSGRRAGWSWRKDDFKAGGLVLDQACRILRTGSKAVRSCHVTLRGDALWLGDRCSQGDEVISLCNTNTVAAGEMMVIELKGEVLARLWLDGNESTLSSWAIALQAAGKLAPRGESEARLRKESLEAEVRRLKKQRQRRKLAYWLQGAVLHRRRSATELLMQWQKSSRLAAVTEESDFLNPSGKDCSMGSVRVMRRDTMSRAENRSVDLLGDVLCTVHEDGREEEPVILQGCSVYLSNKALSVWSDGELRLRFFFDTEQLAESWAGPLQSAAELVAKAKSKPMLRVAAPQKPKVAPESEGGAVSPQAKSSGLHRARRYGGSNASLQDLRSAPPTSPAAGSTKDEQKLPTTVMGG